MRRLYEGHRALHSTLYMLDLPAIFNVRVKSVSLKSSHAALCCVVLCCVVYDIISVTHSQEQELSTGCDFARLPSPLLSLIIIMFIMSLHLCTV